MTQVTNLPAVSPYYYENAMYPNDTGKIRQMVRDFKERFHQLIIYLIFTVFSLNAAFGQQQKVEQHFNTWWASNNMIHFNNKWSVLNELHLRRSNGFMEWQQILVRPSVHYKISDHLTTGAGYTYVLNFPYNNDSDPINVPEHNVWQQLLVKHNVKMAKFSHRIRMEERFIGQPVLNDQGNYAISAFNYSSRFRYQLGVVLPINEEKHVYFKTFDELFINLENSFVPERFSQNRIYAGVCWKFTNSCKLDVGVMDQLILHGNPNSIENNLTTSCTLSCHIGSSQ